MPDAGFYPAEELLDVCEFWNTILIGWSLIAFQYFGRIAARGDFGKGKLVRLELTGEIDFLTHREEFAEARAVIRGVGARVAN